MMQTHETTDRTVWLEVYLHALREGQSLEQAAALADVAAAAFQARWGHEARR